jgi:DNA repair protein RadC
MSKLTITQWGVSDRPREKYLSNGFSHLSDAELIAILLRNGSSSESAVELSKSILNKYDNSLNKIADLSVKQLTQFNGVGHVKAITLLTAFELGRRRTVEKIKDQDRILSPQDLCHFMQDKNGFKPHEEFWAIYVNQNSNILGSQMIGQGGLTATSVDIRLIIKMALELSATGLFVCHNHPSGQLKPSQADKTLTQQLKEATNLLNIQLLDHVIVYKDSCYSFFEEDIL